MTKIHIIFSNAKLKDSKIKIKIGQFDGYLSRKPSTDHSFSTHAKSYGKLIFPTNVYLESAYKVINLIPVEEQQKTALKTFNFQIKKSLSE